MDAGRELEEADILLRKADALLGRHKGTDTRPVDDGDEADDIPILTDVVAGFVPRTGQPGPHAAHRESIEMAELLVGLDTELAREIETWFAEELPQLVAGELDRLAAKLRAEAIAHMRATLMPALSERIAKRLGQRKRGDG
jgi:hypothetical protein